MKHTQLTRILALLLALLACGFGAALAEDDEPLYVENEWGFVETSMDVSQGIPETATEGLARIQAAGVLRVATEPYFAPQEFIDPDLEGQARYVGADMELAKLIAERMGVALEIVPMDFSEVLDAVADGRCDLAISALAFTSGRAAKVEMSKGYHYGDESDSNGLVIREADAADIRSIADLAGRDIAAQSGSLQEMLMAENVHDYRQFRRLASVQDVYFAVQQGIVDAALVNVETTQVYIKHNPDCALVLVPDVEFELDEHFKGDRIAAKKGEMQLMYFVNGVIDEVLASGQYETWFKSYAARADELGL